MNPAHNNGPSNEAGLGKKLGGYEVLQVFEPAISGYCLTVAGCQH